MWSHRALLATGRTGMASVGGRGRDCLRWWRWLRKQCSPYQRAAIRIRALGGQAQPCPLRGPSHQAPQGLTVQRTSLHTVWRLLYGESWVVWGQGLKPGAEVSSPNWLWAPVAHVRTMATARFLSEGGGWGGGVRPLTSSLPLILSQAETAGPLAQRGRHGVHLSMP